MPFYKVMQNSLIKLPLSGGYCFSNCFSGLGKDLLWILNFQYALTFLFSGEALLPCSNRYLPEWCLPYLRETNTKILKLKWKRLLGLLLFCHQKKWASFSLFATCCFTKFRRNFNDFSCYFHTKDIYSWFTDCLLFVDVFFKSIFICNILYIAIFESQNFWKILRNLQKAVR